MCLHKKFRTIYLLQYNNTLLLLFLFDSNKSFFKKYIYVLDLFLLKDISKIRYINYIIVYMFEFKKKSPNNN